MSAKTWAGRALALWPLCAVFIAQAALVASLLANTERPRPPVANPIDTAMGKARKMAQSGRTAEAATQWTFACNLARRLHDPAREAKALRSLSGCRIRLFDYRGAKQAAERSREIALHLHDATTAGGATVNLATIYQQLGDYPQAGREAGRAAELLENSPNKEILVKALLIYANTEAERIRARRDWAGTESNGAPQPGEIAQLERNYQRGIEIAHASNLSTLEAQLWEEMGYSLLLAHCPERAQEPLRRASVIESALHDGDALAYNQAIQAELLLQKQNFRPALTLIDQAFASQSESFHNIPEFYPLHIRGLLLERLNRAPEALAELKKAVDAANLWRQNALPGDATRTLTVVQLHDVYNDYAQLAADLSLKTHNDELGRQALEALARNRAANLRDEIMRAYSQRAPMPPHYYDLLAELQSAQARVTLGDGRPEDKARLEQVRLEIGGIENELRPNDGEFSRDVERKNSRNSLREIQARLSGDEVLLSFSLGKERSFLWAVTENSVDLYRIAGENPIGALAHRFSLAVQRRQTTDGAGPRLSRELFGQLPSGVWGKPKWLIVGDGVLLSGVPFAALTDLSNEQAKSLADSHNLRFIPSEFLLLSADKVRARRFFVGIGDPIYNIADPRAVRSKRLPARPDRASTALSRLPGSDREVRAAARESGLADADILVGAKANAATLQKAIAQKPAILHFAVHVVSPDGNRAGAASSGTSQAALALSLSQDQVPELLTPEAIATLRLPGSLVILSGCSSQKGEVLPGAGLMGLSRAWLLAGASAVVVSGWPTPDDSGRFFSSFYKHFDAVPSGTLAERAATALDQAQIEMEHGGGYRSAPNFWAAYSIISKE